MRGWKVIDGGYSHHMVEVPCAFLQLGFPPYLELELSTPANFGELMLRFDKLSFTTKITESLINRPALNDLSKCKMTMLKLRYHRLIACWADFAQYLINFNKRLRQTINTFIQKNRKISICIFIYLCRHLASCIQIHVL